MDLCRTFSSSLTTSNSPLLTSLPLQFYFNSHLHIDCDSQYQEELPRPLRLTPLVKQFPLQFASYLWLHCSFFPFAPHFVCLSFFLFFLSLLRWAAQHCKWVQQPAGGFSQKALQEKKFSISHRAAPPGCESGRPAPAHQPDEDRRGVRFQTGVRGEGLLRIFDKRFMPTGLDLKDTGI